MYCTISAKSYKGSDNGALLHPNIVKRDLNYAQNSTFSHFCVTDFYPSKLQIKANVDIAFY